MKSKFVKTLLVSSLVATIATGCGDDKDNNKSANTQAKNAGSLVLLTGVEQILMLVLKRTSNHLKKRPVLKLLWLLHQIMPS